MQLKTEPLDWDHDGKQHVAKDSIGNLFTITKFHHPQEGPGFGLAINGKSYSAHQTVNEAKLYASERAGKLQNAPFTKE